MKTARFAVWALSFPLLLSGYATHAAGPLPEFTFKGVALHPKDVTFAPTGELERPSLIKMDGRVKKPTGGSADK